MSRNRTGNIADFAALAAFLLVSLSFPALADFRVNKRQDKVVLKDGKEIICQIIAESKKGIMVIIPDEEDEEVAEEKFITRNKIKKIIYGKKKKGAPPKVEGFQTGEQNGEKVVTGKGFRDDEADEEEEDEDFSDGNRGPRVSTAGQTTWKPIMQTSKSNNKKGSIQGKDLSQTYSFVYPELIQSAETILGRSVTQEWIEAAQNGNREAQKTLEDILETVVSEEAEEEPAGKPTSTTGGTPEERRIARQKFMMDMRKKRQEERAAKKAEKEKQNQ